MADVRRHARSRIDQRGCPRCPSSFAYPEAVLWVLADLPRPRPCWPSTSLLRVAVLVKHLPLFFDLVGRRVVVVGEGPAADRRADLARSAGAEVQRSVARLSRPPICAARPPSSSPPAMLDRDAAAQRAAKSAGVPVNVADRPALCDFILPAIVDRDDVVVAISTGGASPTLATILRGRIEAVLPERIGAVAQLAATFRAQVNALIGEPARRRAFWRRLVEGPAARLALAGDDAGARRVALGELDAAPPPHGARRASPISSAPARAIPIS